MTYQICELSFDEVVGNGVASLEKEGFLGLHGAYNDLFLDGVQPHFSLDIFHDRTRRATAPLLRVDDLIAYGALYSAQHFFRFRHLLALVQKKSRYPERQRVSLNVIDYGCGQGLATLAFLEHLHFQQSELDIDVHLVEPSPLSLRAARDFVTAAAARCSGEVRVHTHQFSLDSVPTWVFEVSRQTVHLFSNILDIAGSGMFNLRALLQQIRCAPGNHLCLGVSPTYVSGVLGFHQLRAYFPDASCLLYESCLSTEILPHVFIYSADGCPMNIDMVRGRAMALQFRISDLARRSYS